MSPGDLLARLVADARLETQLRRAILSEDAVERLASTRTPIDFASALRGPGLSLIAEMKRRTPSMGALAHDYRPADLARTYASGGAAAISVLTHEAGFGGRPEHVREAREETRLPILRKDFVTESYQIVEARAVGADAVLLIVAALDETLLKDLLVAARRQQIAALVEVHDEHEAGVALGAGATVVGVNHRDLRTFQVDLGLTERLRPLIPPEVVLVAESGIRTPGDARRMRESGADAILVGEELMRSADPATRIRELLDSTHS